MIPIPAWAAGDDGSVDFLSQKWLQYTGLALEEVLGWGWKIAFHPDDQERVERRWREIIQSRTLGELDARLRRHDGFFRWFMIRVTPGRDQDGNIFEWYGTFYDIEVRKSAEILLEGQNRILEMVASGNPLDSILRSLCGLSEEAAPGSFSSIVIADSSGSRIEKVLSSSLPEAFTAVLLGRPLGGEGEPSTMAMNRRTQVIVSDVDLDPRWEASGWRELALAHGLRTCWSTPVLSPDGRGVASFAVFWREPGTPTQEHEKMIEQLTHLASMAIERGRTAEALRASEHLARGQLETMTRTLTIMAKETDPDRLLEHVLATIGSQLGAHSIAVCEYREGAIVRIADCGKGRLHFLTPEELKTAPRQSVATKFHPIWSDFFERGAHCVQAEIDVNPRLRLAGVQGAPTYDSWPSLEEVPPVYRAAMEKMRAEGVVASLAVPLFVEGRVTGLLNVRFEKVRDFSSDELALTQALAHQAMLALQLLHLSRQSREAAVGAERNRMARDIHDTLAQGFTGIIIQLDAAKRALKRRALAKAVERLGRAEDLARVGLGEARRSVLALRPRSLESLSVRRALEDLFTRMTSGSGLRTGVEIVGAEPPLCPEWKEVLLRVAQESLTNTIKHAHARTFKATLAGSPDGLRLDFVDDGSGFNPKKGHDGFGLQGMKERIDMIGGKFVLSSAEGEGTRIHIILKKLKNPESLEEAADAR
jgi:PAS domain S-box-containing protein